MTHSRQDDPEPLEELGQRYELLHRLREEPWGEVWLAEDRLLGVQVGLKLYPRSDPDWPAGQKVLTREAALSLTLRHPLILGVFFLGEADDGLYLVEEPFAGESLMDLLSRKKRFSLPQTIRLLEQIGQALAFAHQRAIAHQGFNPLHILIKGEEAKLANFACPAGEEEQATHLELRAYTPPEVLHGEEVTPAGNVFSLGVLGYRLLAGSLPYPLTFDEPFPYRLETMPVDLEEIPLPLQNLLLQCLAPEAENRFADAGAFLAQLRQLREVWPAGGPEAWPAEEAGTSQAGWRQAGAGLLGRIGGACKQGVEKMSGKLRNLSSRVLPASRRLRWGLGLVGAVIVVVIISLSLREPSPAPPESSSGVAALPGPAAPAPGGAPPAGTREEPVAPAEPATPGKPGVTQTTPATPPAPPVAPAPPPEKPAVKEDKYAVIAGTFTQLDQARSLAKRLKSKKYQCQITKTTVKGKPSYQVRLGPFPGKKAADETAKRLKTKEHLNPSVVKVKAKPAKTATTAGATR